MFQKHRMTNPIPDGLYCIDADMPKGTAVFRKFIAGTDEKPAEFILTKPTSEDEAKDFYGFIDAEIEFKEHKESFYDVIKKGTRTRCYTRVRDNSIKTTEFVGDLAIGDKCVIGYADKVDAGKVRKATTGETATLEVVETFAEGTAYEFAMVAVRLL